MRNYLINFLTILVFSLPLFHCANVDYDGVVQINLYHDLTGDVVPNFTERGNLTITSLRSGTSHIFNNVLSDEEKEKLTQLAQNGKLYRLKSVVTNYDGTVTDLYSFLKACMLADSNLSDTLTIALDYSGLVVAVTESIPNLISCDQSTFNSEQIRKFNTNVYIQHTEVGPIPDTASYIQKIEREREARERGEAKDNRSFLAKYWMYIVPVVVFMLISSAANPEGAAGASAGGR